MKISFKTLQSMPAIIGGVTKWRGVILAVLAGAVASFAMPPYSCLAMLFFAGILFLWLLLAAKSKAQAAILGFCFGFGFFAVGLAWVNNAILLFAPHLSFLTPLVIVAFGVWGGSFVAVATLAAFCFKKNKWAFVLSFASAFMIMEWVRSWLWTGFPWNLTALAWDKSDYVMQSLALFGSYGLGLVTWILIGVLALVPFVKKKADAVAVLVAFCIVVSGLYGYGFTRLATAEKEFDDVITVRLVQPNIKSQLTWDRKVAEENFSDLIALTKNGLEDNGVTHVIWGETAVPFPLYDGSPAVEKIMKELPFYLTIISGTVRKDERGVYNSAVVINSQGKIIGTYDKSHLVPFGEYVPLRGILPLEKFTPGMGDFTAGEGPSLIEIPYAGKISMLICYEAIFPAAAKKEGTKPDWLLNLTYDGWYGASAGPYQHFAAARMRAIEEGLPLVRVASTGISGVIDPYGEVVEALPLDTRGVLDIKLPIAIESGTLYGDFGNTIPLGLAFAVLLFSLLLCNVKRR